MNYMQNIYNPEQIYEDLSIKNIHKALGVIFKFVAKKITNAIAIIDIPGKDDLIIKSYTTAEHKHPSLPLLESLLKDGISHPGKDICFFQNNIIYRYENTISVYEQKLIATKKFTEDKLNAIKNLSTGSRTIVMNMFNALLDNQNPEYANLLEEFRTDGKWKDQSNVEVQALTAFSFIAADILNNSIDQYKLITMFTKINKRLKEKADGTARDNPLIIISGGLGAGKGTLISKLNKTFGFQMRVLATGTDGLAGGKDTSKQEGGFNYAQYTPLLEAFKPLMNAGLLLPTNWISVILSEIVSSERDRLDKAGEEDTPITLDGFPRSKEQAEVVLAGLESSDVKCIILGISPEGAGRRALSRMYEAIKRGESPRNDDIGLFSKRHDAKYSIGDLFKNLADMLKPLANINNVFDFGNILKTTLSGFGYDFDPKHPSSRAMSLQKGVDDVTKALKDTGFESSIIIINTEDDDGIDVKPDKIAELANESLTKKKLL